MSRGLKEGRGYLVPEPGAALPCSELAGRKLRVASVLMNPTLSEGLVEEGPGGVGVFVVCLFSPGWI